MLNIHMPRLSLYRPERSHDYEFLDKMIYEQFTVGGTDLLIHKYLGPKSVSPDDATQNNQHMMLFKKQIYKTCYF